MQVLLSVVPSDELPALIEDSLSLPPIDLTLPASADADLAVLALVPVPRPTLAKLAAELPPVVLKSAIPETLNYRKPIDLLKFFHLPVPTVAPGNWQDAIGTQVYGYYIRQRSAPALQSLVVPVANSTTTLFASPIAGISGVTLTATVSPSSALGTVTFTDGSTTLGTVGLGAATATLVVPTLATGQHTLTARYRR